MFEGCINIIKFTYADGKQPTFGTIAGVRLGRSEQSLLVSIVTNDPEPTCVTVDVAALQLSPKPTFTKICLAIAGSSGGKAPHDISSRTLKAGGGNDPCGDAIC